MNGLVLKAYKKPIHFDQYFISEMNCDIEPTCVTKMKISFSQYLLCIVSFKNIVLQVRSGIREIQIVFG